jgi:hypothetical protein
LAAENSTGKSDNSHLSYCLPSKRQAYGIEFRVLIIIIIIIIITVIIICKTRAIAFLRRFCQIASPFHLFGFRSTIFFTEQGCQPCAQTPTWRTRSLYLCHPVTGWPSYTPRHRVPFSSPLTNLRATVEVFEPASTRDNNNNNNNNNSDDDDGDSLEQ